MLFIHALILFITQVFNKEIKSVPNYGDWKTIETLAEEYPYVVAILNHTKDYVCTGTIIHKRTVLTSGGCINPEPYYVTVGNAVFSKNQNNNSIFKIAFSKLHGDYIFDFQETDLSIRQMHSNIGLMFTIRPFLTLFLECANIGNYFASELKGKKLLMVGYENIKASEALALQQQTYHQIACKNPKWYYCVCGIEYSVITYEEPFGEGAPVLYNNIVVGIAANPSGSLILKKNINYNIFTVTGPYLPWIEKSISNSVLEFRDRNGVYQTEKCEKRTIVVINVMFIFNKLIS